MYTHLKAICPQWSIFKQARLLPAIAKDNPDDPRNGILLCKNHHATHEWPNVMWYIRFVPNVGSAFSLTENLKD